MANAIKAFSSAGAGATTARPTSRIGGLRRRSAVATVRCQAAPAAAVAAPPMLAPVPAPVPVQVPLPPTPLGQVFCLGAEDVDRMVAHGAGERLVVVDVMTTRCGPCKVMAPELDKMAAELGDRVVLAKLDCTTDMPNRRWAHSQQVKALPTFILFKGGRRVGDMTGAKAASLRKLINAHM